MSTCMWTGGYFSCCEALTTFFTRETKMTLPHVSLLVFSCCVVFTTFFIREMKMNSSHEFRYFLVVKC